MIKENLLVGTVCVIFANVHVHVQCCLLLIIQEDKIKENKKFIFVCCLQLDL